MTRTAPRGQPSRYRPLDQRVLAVGGLPVAFDLGQRGLADIDHRRPPQMRRRHLELTHRWPPPSRSARRPWRSRRPAARSPPRPPPAGRPPSGQPHGASGRWRRRRVGHQTELDRLHGSPPRTVTSPQPVPAPPTAVRPGRRPARTPAADRQRPQRRRRLARPHPDRSASVHAAGTSDLLPSGNTSSNSTAPCLRMPPSTCSDWPSNGCRGLVILTDDGKSSTRVVRRGFVRRDRSPGPDGPGSPTHRRQAGPGAWSSAFLKPGILD